MDSILKGALEEELERNLQKQRVFRNEFLKYHKGSLVIAVIHGDKYLYRKYREGKKVVSEFIGRLNSEKAIKAYADRQKYLQLKQDIKYLIKEERGLRKAISLL